LLARKQIKQTRNRFRRRRRIDVMRPAAPALALLISTLHVIDLRDGRTVNEVHTARRIPFVLTPAS
jgi:hypothetical protein